MNICHHCKKNVAFVTISGLILCLVCFENNEIFHEGGLKSKHAEPYNEPPIRAIDNIIAVTTSTTASVARITPIHLPKPSADSQT